MNVDKATIAVTGVGMVSTLGLDVVTSCAAAHAGLIRRNELEFEVFDHNSGDSIAIKGCSVPQVTYGFEKMGRLIALGAAAFKDLLNRSLAKHWSENIGFVVHIGNRFYENYQYEIELRQQIKDSDIFAEVSKSYRSELANQEEWAKHHFIENLLKSVGGEREIGINQIFLGGSACANDTLQIVMNFLKEGKMKKCIFMTIDSLLETSMLEALQQLGLLGSEVNPGGIIPGEAAACILLEKHKDINQSELKTLGIIETPFTRVSSNHRFSDNPPDPLALTTVIKNAIGSSPSPELIKELIGVNNGDRYRSSEISTTLVALSTQNVFTVNPVHVSACEAFGEIGAASLGVLICMAVCGFERGYIQGPKVLLWMVSDDGKKGAVIISKT